MDQRTGLIEQDIKDILATRVEISHKIQLLDESARHEYQNLKKQWSCLTSEITENGQAFLDHSMRTLSPARQIQERPWMTLGMVVLVGYGLGTMEKRHRAKVHPYYPPQADGVSVMPDDGKQQGNETDPGVYPYYPRRHRKAGTGSSSGSPELVEVWDDVTRDVRNTLERSQKALAHTLSEFLNNITKLIVTTILESLHSRSSDKSRNKQHVAQGFHDG